MASPSRKSRSSLLRSLSPSARFSNSPYSSSSPPPSSTRVTFSASTSSSSVRFTSISPNRSIKSGSAVKNQSTRQKRTCMCSPTTHPGSFRCSLHKGFASSSRAPYGQNRLNARRSAMTNSLVRIGGVEGDLVKRALSALIRPSSHQQRRRSDFRPRPSRLSVMYKAHEDS